MFVQAARYMHNHNANEDEMMKFRCYGVEKEPDTVKLAKMNLLLNKVRGEITEANSFYSDPYNAFGRFDYVMANPPFNVDEVIYERVKDDPRFNTYGIPRNKSKSTKKDSDKRETVPNANYLWISYFAAALKEGKGRAGLVMANSASDAGNSEYEIRKKMIEEGIIKQMVTIPSNMFSSVTLPATLWFFDKSKPNTDKKDEILFIDARNVFTQVDRAHRKFSDEQIKNLGIITKLYDGNEQAFKDLIAEYKDNFSKAPETSNDDEIKPKAYWEEQIKWLEERFPEGKYQDVIGLCKVAKLDGEEGISEQEYSLNVGRYVGISFDSYKVTQDEFVSKHSKLMQEFDEMSEKVLHIRELLLEKTKFLMEDEKEVSGWHIGRVEELGKFVRGKNITAKEMLDGDIPVVSAGIEPSGYHNQYNVKGPAITISSSGANSGYIAFHLNNIWAADCSYNNDSKYIYYLYEILHFIQPIITNLQRGAAQPHVYAKDVNKIKIIIPPNNVLKEINEMFKVYHTQKDMIKKQLQNTEEQIGLVITKLLCDKLNVK